MAQQNQTSTSWSCHNAINISIAKSLYNTYMHGNVTQVVQWIQNCTFKWQPQTHMLRCLQLYMNIYIDIDIDVDIDIYMAIPKWIQNSTFK